MTATAPDTDRLRELEADIRIMGLNTTLECGRLGVPGRPLSAIAQELRDCGSRTASHAAAALTDWAVKLTPCVKPDDGAGIVRLAPL